jgi:uncharacterized protein YgiM (DUF1202 family)
MKKLFILLIMGLAAAGFVSGQVSRGATLYVAVKSLNLKSSTGFFASNRGVLNYGDRVIVLQVSGKFAEVRNMANSSVTGWMPSANLSVKQIVSGSSSTASASEIALAGKGFNQEVENAYKTKGNLNYADVDRVETVTVREADLLRFLEEGRLAMGDN